MTQERKHIVPIKKCLDCGKNISGTINNIPKIYCKTCADKHGTRYILDMKTWKYKRVTEDD